MAVKEVMDYLHRRAGDDLRGIVLYDDEAMRVIHLRNDIRKHRLKNQVEAMLDRIRPESQAAEEAAFPFGDLFVTVRRFEHAIIMHFPLKAGEGVVVALEPETAQSLNTFTSDILDRLHESP